MNYPVILLSVDAAERGDFSGTYTVVGGQDRRVPFEGAMALFCELESLMDRAEEGAADVSAASGPPMVRSGAVWAGGLATFLIRPLCRRHHSWQGSVMWFEGGQEQTFRSALELAVLLRSALLSDGDGQPSGRLRTMARSERRNGQVTAR